MAEEKAQNAGSEVPEVAEVVEKRSKFSIVWLIPIIAALIGGWLLVEAIMDQGVPITLSFESAAGMEAEKTKIKLMEVEIGVVNTIEVSPDLKRVILSATVDRTVKDYLKEDSRFWVVRPRFSAQGISGLGTLLSGAYIALEPGSPESNQARDFVGLERPPILNLDAPGHEYILHAETLGSLNVGSPIYYRGLNVGEVVSYELDSNARGVTLRIFVNSPHHVLIWEETQFWDVSGIDVSMDANGLSVQTASLESLLVGGIEFETPSLVHEGTPARDGAEFKLHRRHQDIDPHFGKQWKYVLYFGGSIRGLSVGAPVEFRGLQVGEVVGIGSEFELERILIPVSIELEPERLGPPDPNDEGVLASTQEEADANIARMITKGLRARLQTGSLLTGKLFVDLTFLPESPENYARGRSPLFEIPTVPTQSFADIEKSVMEVLEKLKELPVEELVSDLRQAVKSLDKILDDPNIPGTIESTNATLDQAQGVFATLEALMAPESPAVYHLTSALEELASAARSIRVLTAYLEQHPEALIQGKSGSGGK